MANRTRRTLTAITFAMLGLAATLAPGCGGSSATGAGRGLILLSFGLAGVDNVVLNERLTFIFSENVDPSTITNASIQIREGPQFGVTAPGTFTVSGSTVTFEPVLPSQCDLSDAGFKSNTTYRVQIIGAPEEFAIRNSAGQQLRNTQTYEFNTRADNDPTKFRDAIPGAPPVVTSTSPMNGDAAVKVESGNRVEIVLSENLDPCTVSHESVSVKIYEVGDPNVNVASGNGTNSGFAVGPDIDDQTPGDPFTWGATGTTTLSPAQSLPVLITLEQDFSSTKIILTPLQGYNPDPLKSAPLFPENTLLVVQLTIDIADFGNQALSPATFAFTTENLPPQNLTYLLDSAGETAYNDAGTTADVNTARSPSRVQGFLLFSGDADNGSDLVSPSGPYVPSCDLRANDGTKDPFDPNADVVLDTGASVNTCANGTDGSTAVVYEFQTFRIRSGVTVRIIGVNPAILLVEGDVTIDSGGTLVARGDGQGGSPDSRGGKGRDQGTKSDIVVEGGVGVAGGGDGGDATKVENNNQNWKYGHDGLAGFGSPDYDPTMPQTDPIATTVAPTGGGEGGAPVGITTSSPWDGTSSAGGGGGHAEPGLPGDAPDLGTNWKLKLPVRSKGGATYESDPSERMLKPEAGSGGGAAGHAKDQPWRNSTSEGTGGGSGGAGGGFFDITSNGDINVFGTLDAAGARGGDGERWNVTSGDRGITGGGGGGSGGGIRLLTPNDIIFGGTTTVTVAGGPGGVGARHAVTRPGQIIKHDNDGGDGGNGRLVMEDGDSIISGLGAASVTPGEGDPGFFRGVFDATRFQGGGLEPQATTEVFSVGPLNPVFDEPNPGDFVAALPTAGAPGIGKTGIFIEVRGYQIAADGTPDLTTETDWFSIGYFEDTGVETLPAWMPGQPGDVPVAPDNALDGASPHGNSGSGFTGLNAAGAGRFEFIQIRISMFLNSNVSVSDAGALLDDWTIHFTADN